MASMRSEESPIYLVLTSGQFPVEQADILPGNRFCFHAVFDPQNQAQREVTDAFYSHNRAVSSFLLVKDGRRMQFCGYWTGLVSNIDTTRLERNVLMELTFTLAASDGRPMAVSPRRKWRMFDNCEDGSNCPAPQSDFAAPQAAPQS